MKSWNSRRMIIIWCARGKGLGITQLEECQTHYQNVTSSIPRRTSQRIFCSRVSFLCWPLFSVCSTPLLLPKVQVAVQFSPLTDWVIGKTWLNDSAQILFQSCLQEAIVSSSGMGQDIHSIVLSIQHFLSKAPWRMVFKRHVTCPNHATFHLLTVARRGSCGPTR